MSETTGDASPEQRYHEKMADAELKLSVRSIPELMRASCHAELQALGLLQALDNDPRPTFVIDVASEIKHDALLDLAYQNPALAAVPELVTLIERGTSADTMFAKTLEPHPAFTRWLWGEGDAKDPARRGMAYLFGEHLWCVVKVEHFSIVSGISVAMFRPAPGSESRRTSISMFSPESTAPKNKPQFVSERLPSRPKTGESPDSRRQRTPSFLQTYGPFDFTLEPPPEQMSEHVKFFRSVDWKATPLGPLHAWSPQLRCVVNMMMNDKYPAVLFWGDEVTMIYNEAYVEIIGLLHPCMGQSAREAAKEYWPLFQPIVDHINVTGETWSDDGMPLFLDRHGFLEEAYFSFQFTPIFDGAGYIVGYYQPLVETTKAHLVERRVSNLVEIGSQTAKARDLSTFWDLVLNTLAINGKDAPLALLYAAEHQDAPGISCVSTPGSMGDLERYVLKGSIGVDADHLISPAVIDMKEGNSVFHPYLVNAVWTKMPVVAYFSDLNVGDDGLANIDWKGYGDPCRAVVVCPVLPTTGEQVQGFLVLGINPRRPFDEDYQQFVHVMLRLLATSLASVVLFDDEMRQKENAIGQAARIQEQLVAQIQLKERKFQRYADGSDVAIFVVDGAGKYTYRNKSWYNLFDAAVSSDTVMGAWADVVWPEDISVAEGIFAKLVTEKVSIDFELRTSMPWQPPGDCDEPEDDPQTHYKWILCSAYPELDDNNNIIEIVGNVTDISKQKWAEGLQKLKFDSALESKRHLEHFIDTTSHEMRNPLSAIMQCADAILTSYPGSDDGFPVPSPTTYANLLEQNVDAAQTIAQCAQHMKRIVDDILTISKLDSGLLIITPVDAEPKSVASHAVKMFESEAKAADVDMTLHIDQSYHDLKVGWVSLDPTRLLQVLINLITNALKFTRLESKRHIKVIIAASEKPPTSASNGIQFETKLIPDDSHLVDDWKRGSAVYLQFSVADTGRGLTEEERTTLFARFSQASPRTHIHYGGSGLGLFISRRLTEMQGGSIGLSSEYKQGSTFSFYIKARRTVPRNVRRSSIAETYPEDMRHRATTRREIDTLHRLANSPSREKLGRSEKNTPTTPRPRTAQDCAVPQLNSPRPPKFMRQQSALNSDVPPETMGLPRDLDLAELKKTKSIPDTLHVLVVEDNLVNQKVLAKQLRNLGCVVSVANHGAEALEFLKTTRHWRRDDTPPTLIHASTTELSDPFNTLPAELSLILMDWEMPVMNGLTAVARIRDLERKGTLDRHIPVIGVTANVRPQQVEKAMDAGMDDVVSKPFRVAELMGRMRGFVGVGVG